MKFRFTNSLRGAHFSLHCIDKALAPNTMQVFMLIAGVISVLWVALRLADSRPNIESHTIESLGPRLYGTDPACL